MKLLPPILAILLALPGANAEESESTWLRFDNGNALSGQLIGLDATTVTWESSLFTGPQTFHTDRLTEIEIPSTPDLHLPEGNHTAVATLTNGDQLRGCLTRVTDGEIGLLTSYAGELVFRRDMVDELRIQDRPDPIYLGPAGLGGWVQSDPDGWNFESGTLVCKRRSSIGRDIGRHERIRVAFDVSWRENTRFKLLLHADSEDPSQMANGYELVCQSQYAYLRKHTAADSSTVGSAGGIPEFNDRDKMRFEILQDLTTGRVRFVIDGRVIDDWQEPAPNPDKMGPFIHFVSEYASGTRISRIMITSWDGLIDGEWQAGRVQGGFGAMRFGIDEEEPSADEPEEGEANGIRLRNGDRVEGAILGIRDGIVKLKTSFNEFELPVSRLRGFALRTPEEAADPELRWEPIRRQGDVRAWFVDGGRVTFQLVGLKDDTLMGRSQTFGEAEFDPGAFSRLEFNIYPPQGGTGR